MARSTRSARTSRTRSRRSSRNTARNQSYTFRNVTVPVGALTVAADGTASRLTDLGARIETTISGPDIELNRAKINRVFGKGGARPTTVGTFMTYSYGLFIGPDTLDAADIDANLEGGGGLRWWTLRSHNFAPNTHLRAVTSATFENETQGMGWTIRTPSPRRLGGFGETLWFAESVQLAGLTDCGWLFDISVEVA